LPFANSIADSSEDGGQFRRKGIIPMNKFTLAAATAALLFGSVASGLAQERAPGASGTTPGHEMQERGSVPGQPGASGYAPGHKDRDDRGMLRDHDNRMERDRGPDRQ
jgi:hypothetical protein